MLFGWQSVLIGTHMSDAVHGLDLVVEAADGRREAVPVGDDELVAQGSGHQHDVVVDEAETVDILSYGDCSPVAVCLQYP